MVAGRAKIIVESKGLVELSAAHEIVFGNRTGCDVVINDAVVAERHCRITSEDGFWVRDLGSVTGTWIDGVEVKPSAQIRDGSEIVLGTSRLKARIEMRAGSPTLVLDLQRRAFWWKKPNKGVFDNDADAMVYAEVGFGRFRTLTVTNRLAIVAAFVGVIAATFFAVVREPLTDAGPLLPAHALVADIAAGKPDPHGSFSEFGRLHAEQRCDVCHTTGAGTPANKCLQCHGDFSADATTWRHPYVADGKLGPLPGIQADESICTLCHTDHQGTNFLKPAADRLLAKCESCHGDGIATFDRAALLAKAPVTLAPRRQRPIATYRFPHDVHLAKKIDCAICHTIDTEVRARFDAGAGSDPARDDFAEASFAVCASCHVPDAKPMGMTMAQQETWRSKENQWPVAVHGTDENGKQCRQCHATAERGGHTVFGPELRTVERPDFTAEQHAAERALYVAGRRRHEAEFEQHSAGQDCTQCHLHGKVAGSAPAARTFWHGLHLAESSLQPPLGKRSEISSNDKDGCASCHSDLTSTKLLRTAAEGGYRWPAQALAQAACKQCHREGNEQLVLQPVGAEIPAGRRAMRADFPHDAHVGSASFGAQGSTMAEGCFACHEFAAPAGGRAFESIPRTRDGVANCTKCHTDHQNIAGNHCHKCHRPEIGQSNSFLLSARVPAGSMVSGRQVPPVPQRSWPALNPFSHISRGHADVACSKCHSAASIESAKTLSDIGIPDDATPACRDCHVEKQFHWR